MISYWCLCTFHPTGVFFLFLVSAVDPRCSTQNMHKNSKSDGSVDGWCFPLPHHIKRGLKWPSTLDVARTWLVKTGTWSPRGLVFGMHRWQKLPDLFRVILSSGWSVKHFFHYSVSVIKSFNVIRLFWLYISFNSGWIAFSSSSSLFFGSKPWMFTWIGLNPGSPWFPGPSEFKEYTVRCFFRYQLILLRAVNYICSVLTSPWTFFPFYFCLFFSMPQILILERDERKFFGTREVRWRWYVRISHSVGQWIFGSKWPNFSVPTPWCSPVTLSNRDWGFAIYITSLFLLGNSYLRSTILGRYLFAALVVVARLQIHHREWNGTMEPFHEWLAFVFFFWVGGFGWVVFDVLFGERPDTSQCGLHY